ncbi:MAG: methyltransferase domain-containing protein [Candidatus Staskawiczbacteria bacterium]|nr:methyltransferase domain-containing protein [Candidatus Staskawiczbacteria bacterium]
MYPPSYQGSVVETQILPDPYFKLPGLRFSYGYQFDLIKKYVKSNATILDYGCGTGHFLANANHHGFSCDGAEFNPDYIKLLSSSFEQSNFYSIENVLSDKFRRTYDVIRLSNVLEHLTNPKQVIEKLSKHLNPGGIFLVEGPIEENFCIATAFRKLYFKLSALIRPNRTVSDPPYHIFLSNAQNQLDFFMRCGLQELAFNTAEDPWPFPSSLKNAKGIQGLLTATIAKISMACTRIFGRKWGNIFIYCGKKK